MTFKSQLANCSSGNVSFQEPGTFVFRLTRSKLTISTSLVDRIISSFNFNSHDFPHPPHNTRHRHRQSQHYSPNPLLPNPPPTTKCSAWHPKHHFPNGKNNAICDPLLHLSPQQRQPNHPRPPTISDTTHNSYHLIICSSISPCYAVPYGPKTFIQILSPRTQISTPKHRQSRHLPPTSFFDTPTSPSTKSHSNPNLFYTLLAAASLPNILYITDPTLTVNSSPARPSSHHPILGRYIISNLPYFSLQQQPQPQNQLQFSPPHF